MNLFLFLGKSSKKKHYWGYHKGSFCIQNFQATLNLNLIFSSCENIIRWSEKVNIGYHICFTQECTVISNYIIMYFMSCFSYFANNNKNMHTGQKPMHFSIARRWTGRSTYIGGFKVKYNKVNLIPLYFLNIVL